MSRLPYWFHLILVKSWDQSRRDSIDLLSSRWFRLTSVIDCDQGQTDSIDVLSSLLVSFNLGNGPNRYKGGRDSIDVPPSSLV